MRNHLIPLVIASIALPSLVAAETLLLYKPPLSEAPKTRIGGGTRGLSLAAPQVQILAPRQLALTHQAQPTLYWYALGNKPQSIEIQLVQEGFEQALLDISLPAPETPSLQTLQLSNYDIRLIENQTYIWTVTAINDPEKHSNDISSSAILRYQPSAAAAENTEQLAEQGYWYDALHTLIDQHSPQANDLLKQVGIVVPPL